MSLLGLSFGLPFVLLGLFLLPAIWWLLRLTPPRPREEVFPPTGILAQVEEYEETPAQSPWWLTLLRLLMASLIIFAMAEPVWNATTRVLNSSGPLLVIFDDGWNSGTNWEERVNTARNVIEEADSAGRPVALVLTSQGAKTDLAANTAAVALRKLNALVPRPVESDVAAIAEKLQAPDWPDFSSIAWLSNGLGGEGSLALASALDDLSAEDLVYYGPPQENTLAITGAQNSPAALDITLEKVEGSALTGGFATAYDQKGRSLSRVAFEFSSGQSQTQAGFELPVELRNEIARVSIDEFSSAGAVHLLDERFRRRRVGLISGGKADAAQPLLSPLYYISRALEPFSELRESRNANVATALPDLLQERISTLVLADIGTLPDAAHAQLEEWIKSGGILIRFAGPRLAAADDDGLVPVTLRRGGRSLGGTLTWGTPQPLSRFEPSSPFAGIPVPGDVAVTKQVLAEPDIDLDSKTWASLKDGTPLVTASQMGSGWVVLFHVTADASWSNLPLSGAFVDMLRRVVAVSNGALAADQVRRKAGQGNDTETQVRQTSMPPLRMLDGYGVLGAATGQAKPLVIDGKTTTVTLENPPGLYGNNDAFVALNLFEGEIGLKPFDTALLPDGAKVEGFVAQQAQAIKPWLLAAALALLAIDCLAVLWMAGAFRRRRAAFAATAILAVLFVLPNQESFAQQANLDFESSLKTRLAYVRTGDRQIDTISRKGLVGLTAFIASRTSLEPGEPVGIDLANDELSFYPLLYWPVAANASVPDAKTMARVDAFMKKGGSVLFDTRDQLSGGFGSRRTSAETLKLREILAQLDIPPLEPVPANHVLTRAFYLLNIFPGRYLDGRLWVETSERKEDDADRPARQGDGVSSILITSNDMAAAWAIEADGSPSLPIVPPNPRQRVYAYRTGVNIIMYTLTGNYKSDQVHVPALLERLGQ